MMGDDRDQEKINLKKKNNEKNGKKKNLLYFFIKYLKKDRIKQKLMVFSYQRKRNKIQKFYKISNGRQ